LVVSEFVPQATRWTLGLCPLSVVKVRTSTLSIYGMGSRSEGETALVGLRASTDSVAS
jgi:hypothetical protein